MSSIFDKRDGTTRARARALSSNFLALLLVAVIGGIVSVAQAQPSNDRFTNALMIADTPGSIMGDNIGATRETNGEPIHYVGSPLSQRSVWFIWTAPQDGIVRFDTVGSEFDTILAAYRSVTGGTNASQILSNLVRLASDDDSAGPYPNRASQIQFQVRAGTNYYIALDGFSSQCRNTVIFVPGIDPLGVEVGNYVLNWTMDLTAVDTNPPPVLEPFEIRFARTNYVVSETGRVATITVLYGGDESLGDITVDFFTADGTAIAGRDYVPTNGTLTFTTGETSHTISVVITNNFAVDGDRTLRLILTNSNFGSISTTNGEAQLTIVDDDAQRLSPAGQFGFSSSSYVVTEFETSQNIVLDDNTTVVAAPSAPGALITVTRSAPATGRVLVDYVVRPAFTGLGIVLSTNQYPGKAGCDFFPATGTLIFDDYQMSATFVVPVQPTGNTNPASALVEVVLSNPRPVPEEIENGATTIIPSIGPLNRAVIQILRVNVPKTFNIERAHYRFNEYGNAGPYVNTGRTVRVSVILPGGGGGSVNVRMLPVNRRYSFALDAASDYADGDDRSYATTPFTDGTPPNTDQIADVDFQEQTLTFPTTGNGQTRQSAAFTITNDNTVEFNEDVRFELRLPSSGIALGLNSIATATILFDDQPAGAADREWNPDGVSRTSPPFNQTPGANNTVAGVIVQPDNRTVIVGDFTSVNGVSRNRVARMNPDGSVDQTFNPGIGADGYVGTVVIYPPATSSTNTTNGVISPINANSGKILIGGAFTSVDGNQRSGIARLNVNGSVDNLFRPGNGADGTVNSIVLQSDGRILVAGDFTHFNDLPANGIMRLNEDGTLDTTFNPGIGANGPIRAMAVRDTAQTIFAPRTAIGTELEDINVIDTGSTRGSITVDYDFLTIPDNIRVFYEGARILDLTTNGIGQLVIPYGPGASTSVTIIMNQGIGITGTAWAYRAFVTPVVVDRTIYVAGEFTAFNGQRRNGVARLLENGTVDPAFDPGIGVDGPIYALAVQANNRVLIGGAFSSFHTQPRSGLARLLNNGSLDQDYHVGSGANDSVYAITLQPDGKAYIGGIFSSYNGTRRMGIARLFEKGSLDTSFMDTAYNQFAGLPKTYSFDPPRYVNSIALGPDGNVMIGGSFTNLGGNYSYFHPRLTTTIIFGNVILIGVGIIIDDGDEIVLGDNNIIRGGSSYAPFTRADKTARFNVARLIGGYTYGPGNLEYDPNAFPFGVDENGGEFAATIRRVDGRLGQAVASANLAANTAQLDDDVIPTSVTPIWRQKNFADGGYSLGFPGLNYFRIPIADDNLREGDETFDLLAPTISGSILLGGEVIPLGAARGFGDFGRVAISDNDFDRGVFNFAVSNFATNENAVKATITVVRTNGSSGPVTVDYLVVDGTARRGFDYTATNGPTTLRFSSTETKKTFTVDLIDNPAVEVDETVVLILTNATGGATIPGPTVSATNTATATLTIIDDDLSSGRLNFSTTTFTNSEKEIQAAVIVTRTGGSVGAISVRFETADGIAGAPADYAARSTVLTWNNGDTTARTVLIPLVSDNLVEGPETVNLRLVNPLQGTTPQPGLLGGRTNATLTILDSDAFGSFSFSQMAYQSEENGAPPAITVIRRGGSGGTVSVQFATSPLTAEPGVDYRSTNGTLTFLPGELSKTFRVPLVDDREEDGNKTVGLTLSEPVNGELGPVSEVVLTLVDDESINRPAGSLDTEFSSLASANAAVNALLLQTNGSIVVAGDFTELGSVPRNRLARLRSNGVLDFTFDIGPGADGSIRALGLQSDGRLLVGGLFHTINGTNRNGIARLSSDGKVDISFDPGSGADNPIFALLVQPDDRVLVGGSFSTFRNIQHPGLIRLNTNGTIDVSFNVGSGINGIVYAIELQNDGKVLVGGDFVSYNGIARTNLIRLLPDGTVDASFNPVFTVNGPVLALLAEEDGRIVIGGSFTRVNGTSRQFLARLERDGSLDTAFLSSAAAGADNIVRAIKQQVDGKLIIAGDFIRFNGVTRNGITRLNDSDGTTDPTINFGYGANAPVTTLAIQPDGKIMLGGAFTEYDRQPRRYFARIYGGSIAGPGVIEFAAPTFTATEGTSAVINVRRRGGTTGSVSARYSTADGTGKENIDYVSASGTVTFPEGESSATFTVSLLGNSVSEGDRTVELTLDNFVGASAGPQPFAILTILDDESFVRFTAAEYSVNEKPVSGNATIGVFRGGGTNSTVTVNFTVRAGTATPGVDYIGTNGSVVFPPGEVFKNFNIPILEDGQPEANETILLSLSSSDPRVTVTLADAVLVIVNRDFAPGQFVFAFSEFAVDEFASNAVVTVLRTNGSSGAASVRIRTTDFTAFAGLDYVGLDQLLSFADGETSKSVLIPILDDLLRETIEIVNLDLAAPSGSTSLGTPSTATLNIKDDDAPIIVSAGATLLSEGLLPTNGVIDPGETVTVLFALRNTGFVDANNVVASLFGLSGVTVPTTGQSQSFGALAAGGGSVSRPFTFTAVGTNGSVITAALFVSDGLQSLGILTFDFILGPRPLSGVSPNPITINDNAPASPYPATATVSGESGVLTKLTVTLRNITHPYPDDLDIVLVSPDGSRRVMLMSDAGGGNTNALSNVTITFDDAASSPVPDNSKITTGSYRPANWGVITDPLTGLQPPYGTALSDFNGIDPNGVWKLYIVDDSNQDAGVISGGWSLSVATAAATAALPLLACERSASGADIVLRWNTTADVQLVSAPSLSSTTWSPVTEPVSVSGGVSRVTVPTTSPAKFYRLRRNP